MILVDPSPAMLDLAEKTVREAHPEAVITPLARDLQHVSGALDRHVDVAMSSLAHHHMPLEGKERHLRALKPWIDHVLLFELNANNDTPAPGSPALALTVYQSYGRIIDFVLSHDAPVDVASGCVDCFLMSEPCGTRTAYHMLRNRWNALFRESLGPGFTLLCRCVC